MTDARDKLLNDYLALNEKYDKMAEACLDLVHVIKGELTSAAQIATPELVHARGLLDIGGVPAEYKDLKEELGEIGYDLRVMQRRAGR